MGKKIYVESVESVSALRVKPVSKSFGRLTVGKAIDGSLIEIPFAVIRGKEEKPTIWIQATLHGDEYVGSEAIRRIINNLDPENIQGTVIAFPIVNTTAYSAHRRYSPFDNRDLCLSFTGNSSGLFSERLAGLYLKEILSLLTDDDCIIDLHSGPEGCAMEPWVAYQATGDISEEKSKKSAEASGIRVIVKNVPRLDYKSGLGLNNEISDEVIHAGSQSGELLKRVKLGWLAIESGSSFVLEENVALQYNGIINVMKHLNMLEGSIVKLSEDSIYVNDTRRVMPVNRGFWRLLEKTGQRIQKNQKLAIMTDEFGRIMEEITAPVNGILLVNRLSSFVDPLTDVLSHRFGAFIGIEGR